ncbi:hypothetical protein PilKf_01827 [Pillotina sp. SPG140]|jgi:hypothetical protein
MKTVQEYMNDPRITEDPAMKDSLDLIKEVHAIRLKVQDENKGISAAERNRRAKMSLASHGITFCQDLSGMGKIRVFT